MHLCCGRGTSGRVSPYCHVPRRSLHDGLGSRYGQCHHSSLPVRSVPCQNERTYGRISWVHPLRRLRTESPTLLTVQFQLTAVQGLAGWTGYGCYFLKSQVAQWRLCLALQIVPPLCLLLGSPWLPESPRYLLANDEYEKGFAILQRLHHVPEDDEDTIAREELYQIRKQLDLEREAGWRQGWVKGWILLFRKRSYRKRLLFGFLLL